MLRIVVCAAVYGAAVGSIERLAEQPMRCNRIVVYRIHRLDVHVEAANAQVRAATRSLNLDPPKRVADREYAVCKAHAAAIEHSCAPFAQRFPLPELAGARAAIHARLARRLHVVPDVVRHAREAAQGHESRGDEGTVDGEPREGRCERAVAELRIHAHVPGGEQAVHAAVDALEVGGAAVCAAHVWVSRDRRRRVIGCLLYTSPSPRDAHES
eukprot:5854232-Prymnesium_polylepis.1